MSTTQKPDALSLEEFRAKVTRAAREPLLARIAELEDVADMAIKRIVELEAQLSAIGAGGVEPLRKQAAAPQEVQTGKLPQQEGADYFLVLNQDGDVEFAYNAQLGRDFGHDHIKLCQERETPVAGWVVRPAYAHPA